MKTLTLNEAAETLQVSVSVLRREIEKGRLIGRKFGGRIYIFGDDLENYVDSCATATKPEMHRCCVGEAE